MRITRWFPGSIMVLALGSAPASAGVRPPTQESANDAIKRGQTAKKVNDLCSSFVVETKAWDHYTARFSVFIGTPVCDVAYRAFDAKRKYESFGVEDVVIPPEADQMILIKADPSTTPGGFMGSNAKVDLHSVLKVVLRRGSEIIQPARSDFHEVPFSNAYGKRETYMGGDFAFPLSALDSACDIVVVHDAGEAVKKLDAKDLAKLE